MRSRCATAPCSPLVAVIIALALYPGFILDRAEASVGIGRRRDQSDAGHGQVAELSRGAMNFNAPDIDYAGSRRSSR